MNSRNDKCEESDHTNNKKTDSNNNDNNDLNLKEDNENIEKKVKKKTKEKKESKKINNIKKKFEKVQNDELNTINTINKCFDQCLQGKIKNYPENSSSSIVNVNSEIKNNTMNEITESIDEAPKICQNLNKEEIIENIEVNANEIKEAKINTEKLVINDTNNQSQVENIKSNTESNENIVNKEIDINLRNCIDDKDKNKYIKEKTNSYFKLEYPLTRKEVRNNIKEEVDEETNKEEDNEVNEQVNEQEHQDAEKNIEFKFFINTLKCYIGRSKFSKKVDPKMKEIKNKTTIKLQSSRLLSRRHLKIYWCSEKLKWLVKNLSKNTLYVGKTKLNKDSEPLILNPITPIHNKIIKFYFVLARQDK